MLLPKSSCVCIPCIKSVIPRVCMAKYHFWHNMNTEMGVIIYMYLKHSQIKLIPKLWVHGSNSLDSSSFADTTFLASLALHRKKKEVWPDGTQPMLFHSGVSYTYQALDL